MKITYSDELPVICVGFLYMNLNATNDKSYFFVNLKPAIHNNLQI